MKKRFISKKEGFTLIELLGVIIVLAIITLITTPVITSIIDKAKREAFRNSTYGLVSAGTLYYTEQLLDGGLTAVKTFEIVEGVWKDNVKLDVIGQLPKDGIISVSPDGRVSIAIWDGKYCATKGYDSNDVVLVDDKNKEDCLEKVEVKTKYVEKELNGADPVLSKGMIPVNISSSGEVTVADVYNSTSPWYRYGPSVDGATTDYQKQWANVVLVDSATQGTLLENGNVKETAIGTPIAETNILAYLVWIPRYKYQIFNAGNESSSAPEPIIITFEDKEQPKSPGAAKGDKLTHPAFTFGTEINGFWVGKFESGFNQEGVCGKTSSTLNWTPEIAQGNNTTTNAACTGSSAWGAEAKKAEVDDLLIKPSIPSWRGITVKNMYDMSLALSSSSKFGLTVNDTDSHMMKNMEWGAVAYLSHSVYGKNGEININNCSSYITGKGGAAGDTDSNTTCSAGTTADNWISNDGMGASTTGNITGIYDMSGGAWEYVMGNMYNSGDATLAFGSSGFDASSIAAIDSRYIDKYSFNANWYHRSRGKLGDATKELGPWTNNGSSPTTGDAASGNDRSSWYRDYAWFVYSDRPWFLRGGGYWDTTYAGIFAFSRYDGSALDSRSFRVVVAPVAR